jgi:hypothetical protein
MQMQAGAEQEEIKWGSKRLPMVASRRCGWWRQCCCRVGGTAVAGEASPSSVFFFLFLSFSPPLFCSVLSLLFSLLLSIPLFSSFSSFRPSLSCFFSYALFFSFSLLLYLCSFFHSSSIFFPFCVSPFSPVFIGEKRRPAPLPVNGAGV